MLTSWTRVLQVFELSCPQQIGPIGNNALHKVIVDYVEEEIKGAENAEVRAMMSNMSCGRTDGGKQREPNIVRFDNSIVAADLEDLVTTPDYAHDDDNANACPPATTSNPVTAQPAEVFLHSVCDEGSKSTIKLFNLRDTGPDMLLRVLVDPGRELQHVVYTGFTCRAAKWSPRDVFYAFNGRVGEPIVSEGGDSLRPLFACDLVRLRGVVEDDELEGKEETTPTAPQDPELKHWKFRGDQRGVKQFLDGMGETELVDPDTAPDVSEMPSDARKYNTAPEYQTRTYGRSRRPAVMEPISDEEDVEPSSTEDTEDEDEGDAGSNASSDDSGASQNSMLMMLRNYGPQPATTGEESLVATNAREETPSVSTPRADTSTLGSVLGPSNFQTVSFGGSAAAKVLRHVESSYAKVDKNGLTGNAKLQAEWEHAVPMPSPRKPKNKHGIARRPPTQFEDLSPQPTSNSSAAMSLSTGPDVRAASLAPTPTSSFGAVVPTLEMPAECPGAEPEQQPWANRTVSSAVVTGDLVDVSTSRSRAGNGQVRPPPGFEESFGKPHATVPKSRPTVKSVPSKGDDSHLDDLIGLDFAEPEIKTSRQTSGNYQPATPTFPLFADLCNQQTPAKVAPPDDDDAIVERLQDTSSRKRPLRNTMRQKAGKKKKSGKGKKTASAKPKTELPLPSPPPPPKPKKVEESSSTEAGQHGNEAAESSETNDSQPPTRTTKETEIEKLLAQVEHLHGLPDVELQVSFGMLMVRSKDESFRSGNFNASKLQSRLQAQQNAGELLTDFFERLTASDTDAAYLFDLLPGEALEPKVEYEIGIRLLLGEERTIKFDQNDRDTVKVFAPEQTAVTLFMHYPIRVHDARSRVIKSERATDVDPVHLTQFLSSIHSLDNPPNFKALVPRTAFSVNYVHVNRIFTKEIVPGVQLRVVETQDLHLAPVSDSENFNLLATSTSRAAMVDTHRQWYECSLHLAPVGGVMGEVLQSLIDRMVAEMDGVGFCNRGPYWMTEKEVEDVRKAKFW